MAGGAINGLAPSPQSLPAFPSIQEGEGEEEEEEEEVETKQEEKQSKTTKLSPGSEPQAPSHEPRSSHGSKHQATPLHHRHSRKTQNQTGKSVSCSTCRPSSRDKISIVPLDASHHSSHTPNSPRHASNAIKAFFLSLTKRSPKTTQSSIEEQWSLTVSDLTQKLLQATRKRDEASAEATRLRASVLDLEKKLARLEIHCLGLKNSLDERLGVSSPHGHSAWCVGPRGADRVRVADQFAQAVADARVAVRALARQAGARAARQVHLEALLCRAFYADFENFGSVDGLIDPRARCEANYSDHVAMKALNWEEVLSKGTRHFSEGFSRFCDAKMGAVVSALGWGRAAWPEPLLQAFFIAARGVWVVRLLAGAVHPRFEVFRVGVGAKFEGAYMEDVARRVGGLKVTVMVAPGFYVDAGVVKARVLCTHQHEQGR
ncbi:IRK-interacting protein [Amborella trichopoda]|uniref:DUF641 domain-containing protein n=1 Tax=Amborella trichopoda TaxID=13333 RepID=W1PTI1_AMBTC|nr:IRK-interacting protein [Amborella trichopoda]ERN13327.1 hypothetical protein AMTR_s00041p00096700 [Amborella trichopoda]|eukprot:XP_006851860.1 IRK-interacting protein [Amborella trichopoda]